MFKDVLQVNQKLRQKVNACLRRVASSKSAAQDHLAGGGEVAELEQKLAAHYGMKHALCVSNATTGLFALALALDLQSDEFVCPPYTFGGSLAGWLLGGNIAVFADIDSQTLTLDPEAVRRAVSSRTKAILAVDILGNPCDSAKLRDVADEYGIWYIADCAQSFGAERGGYPASYLADALVVSFTVGKSLYAGEGGAIVTNHSELYQKLIWLTQHPHRQKKELGLELHNEFGINARIHPFAALWANAQFEDSLRLLKKYQTKCLRTIDCLNESRLVDPIDFSESRILPSFFRLTAALKNGVRPDELIRYLTARSILAMADSVPVSLVYRQPAFLVRYKKQFRLSARCEEAERQVRQRAAIILEN